jgi:hypothetical protein
VCGAWAVRLVVLRAVVWAGVGGGGAGGAVSKNENCPPSPSWIYTCHTISNAYLTVYYINTVPLL